MIESYDLQQERENAIELLKQFPLSEKDSTDGKVFSREQLLDGLN